MKARAPLWRTPAARWVALDFLLLALVWGLFAPDRGMFQDDVAMLHAMTAEARKGPEVSIFPPFATPTRRLQGPWFLLAVWSGHPVLFLQLLFGFSWLGIALLARRLARWLAPGRNLEAYLAGALTLCATSDFLTNSLVAIGYQMAILALLGAVACGVAWRHSGRLGYLAASIGLLVISLWTIEVGLSAVPLLPAFLWLVPGQSPSERPRGRLWLLLGGWAAALIPLLLTLASALRDPQSYYNVALIDLGWGERLVRTFHLWVTNFTPWTWAFQRAVWFSRSPLPQPIPPWWIASLVVLGTTAFLWGLRRNPPAQEASPCPPRRAAGVALTLLGLSLSPAAMTAGVQLAELHYRTHLLSRVWTSLFLAFVVGLLARRWRWALAVPVLFVAFGIAGGLERQGFYLGFWRAHQRELASILEAAPAVRPGTEVVLWVPPHLRYLATEGDYARCWLGLLYDDLAVYLNTTIWGNRAGTTECRAGIDTLACWTYGQAECFAAGTCPGRSIPYNRLLVLGFDVDRGTYRILPRLPTEPPVAPQSYLPESRVIRRPLTTSQRRLLLLDHSFLARWIPWTNAPV